MAGLIREARALRLAEDRGWLHLGHYRGKLAGGLESEADGEDFFLSPRGKKSPIDEMSATLAGFFSEPVRGAEQDHPICRFPARLAWLDAHLRFDRALLPAPDCALLRAYRASLDAAKVRLIFSSYYLNTPASAFGHTFLRIDSNKSRGAAARRDLLDYGIDFSANVDTGNSVIYAIKGLTGRFDGVFRKLPYYFKVREYNDVESRDLWEYALRLGPEAVARVVDHLWELGYTSFDYYYLSENCSYHVLGTIAAAVPGAGLLDDLRFPVLPTDTVKALERADLIESIEYRPSLRTVFRARVEGLDRRERELVAELAHEPDRPLPADMPAARRALVLEAAQDRIDIKHYTELLEDPDSRGAHMKQRLLERRAELDVVSQEVSVPTPWTQLPHGGHGSRRWGLTGGADLDGHPFGSLHYRLALHDLSDPSTGFPDTMAIEFLRSELRFAGETRRVRLEELSLIEITSLTPMDSFEKRPSWRFGVGSWRGADTGCDDCFGPGLKFAFGGALATERGGVVGFAMLSQELFWSPHLEGGVRDSTVRLGLGGVAGLRLRLAPTLTWLTEGGWSWLPDQAPWHVWGGASGLRWGLARSLALDLRATVRPERAEAQVGLFHYF